MVARLRAAGAIVIGKTNTPEFGAGSQTFNPVFGATRNPYDLARTPAVAAAARRRRSPPGCCRSPTAPTSAAASATRPRSATSSGCGRRPAASRQVPADPWNPMRRARPDGAQRAGRRAAAAGHGRRRTRARRSRSPDAAGQLRPGRTSTRAGARIAWSRDLGGLPVDPEVSAALQERRRGAGGAGLRRRGRRARPDGARRGLRGPARASASRTPSASCSQHTADGLKDTIVWNTRVGLALTAGARRAARWRCGPRCSSACARCCERYDALALPVSQVAPFPVEQEWVERDRGREMGSYLEWMRSCSRITVTAHPAMSVPAGFTPAGCRSACSSSGATAASWACCASPPGSSGPPRPGSGRPSVIGPS